MNKIVLDLTNCKSLLELHNIIKETFNFPEHYGKNLDALWDCLWEYTRPDTVIYVKGTGMLSKNFDEYMGKIFEIFKRLEDEEENVTFEIIS